MLIFNKGHISHYKKKKLIEEVSNMRKLFKEDFKAGKLVEGEKNECLE